MRRSFNKLKLKFKSSTFGMFLILLNLSINKDSSIFSVEVKFVNIKKTNGRRRQLSSLF